MGFFVVNNLKASSNYSKKVIGGGGISILGAKVRKISLNNYLCKV